jgi:hypothetical protein
MKKITKKHLREWDACSDGYIRFNQLFPDGADLQTASAGLIADGHPEWSNWLWARCKHDDDVQFVSQTTVTVGDHGTAIAGSFGTAIAGYDGIAKAGKYGTATAGDHGIATVGHKGTASAGYNGIATAGYIGTATAGEDGIIIITFYNIKASKYEQKSAHVGGKKGLKPNTPYRLDVKGRFIEVKSTKQNKTTKVRRRKK